MDCENLVCMEHEEEEGEEEEEKKAAAICFYAWLKKILRHRSPQRCFPEKLLSHRASFWNCWVLLRWIKSELELA